MATKFVDIGQRLRAFGERYGSIAAFARELKLGSAQHLYPYLRGDSRPGADLQERLRELGCDIEWLMTGKIRVGGVAEDSGKYLISSPIVAAIKASHGAVVFEYDEEYEANPPGEQTQGLWFRVKGNSMEPRYLHGELVFVHPTVRPVNGEYGVIAWNEHEDAAIRQVFYKDGKVILKSINSQYEPLLLDLNEISFIAAIAYSKSTKHSHPKRS